MKRKGEVSQTKVLIAQAFRLEDIQFVKLYLIGQGVVDRKLIVFLSYGFYADQRKLGPGAHV